MKSTRSSTSGPNRSTKSAELPAYVLALDGELEARSATATRRIAATDFFFGHSTTAIAEDELLTGAILPAPWMPEHTAILEASREANSRSPAPSPMWADTMACVSSRGSSCWPSGRARSEPRPPSGCSKVRSSRIPTWSRPQRRRAPRSSHTQTCTPATRTTAGTGSASDTAIEGPLRLSGTHLGREHGVCGSCAVLVDGEPARACLLLAVQADGADLMTVEGLGTPARLHLPQRAFSEARGLQCGFCTSAMLMTAYAFLCKHPALTRQEGPEGVSRNLCRYIGYSGIVQAIVAAVEL